MKTSTKARRKTARFFLWFIRLMGTFVAYNIYKQMILKILAVDDSYL